MLFAGWEVRIDPKPVISYLLFFLPTLIMCLVKKTYKDCFAKCVCFKCAYPMLSRSLSYGKSEERSVYQQTK